MRSGQPGALAGSPTAEESCLWQGVKGRMGQDHSCVSPRRPESPISVGRALGSVHFLPALAADLVVLPAAYKDELVREKKVDLLPRIYRQT